MSDYSDAWFAVTEAITAAFGSEDWLREPYSGQECAVRAIRQLAARPAGAREAALKCASLCNEQPDRDRKHLESMNQSDDYIVGYAEGCADCAHLALQVADTLPQQPSRAGEKLELAVSVLRVIAQGNSHKNGTGDFLARRVLAQLDAALDQEEKESAAQGAESPLVASSSADSNDARLGEDKRDTTERPALPAAADPAPEAPERPCTCHPDDRPPVPCARRYALSDCFRAAYEEQRDALARAQAELRDVRDALAEARGATYPPSRKGWQCFHCGEWFRSVESAQSHFGVEPHAFKDRAKRAEAELVKLKGERDETGATEKLP